MGFGENLSQRGEEVVPSLGGSAIRFSAILVSFSLAFGLALVARLVLADPSPTPAPSSGAWYDIITPIAHNVTPDTSLGPPFLMSHASAYNGHHVAVEGIVTNVVARISHAGNSYETFNLCSHDVVVCVHVFTWGQPSFSQGEETTVHGTFWTVKHVGSYSYYDEIEADKISP